MILNILNSLVPTVAIALIAWLSLHMLRANAATRYGVWWVVLASVVVMVLRPQNAHVIAPAVAAAAVQLPPATTPMEDSQATWIVVAFVVWTAYALYRSARIVVGYLWLRRIVRDAEPWSRPGVMLSDEVASPITAGFLHSVVLLPASFPEKLTDEEMQHVLLHEEAHIARRDQWANLLARVVGVFFGLHPVAALAMHCIERERERACDDWVVAATGDAKPYAASLTRVFELTRRGSQPDLASGFMGSRLGGRVEELLTQGRQFTRRVSITMMAVIVIPVVILGLSVPSMVAYAQEKQTAQPAQAAKPATPAPPAQPAKQADPTDAVAKRLEALIVRLEAVLERFNQPEPSTATMETLLREKDLAAQTADFANMQNQLKAREAEMRAQEAAMQNEQRRLQQQLRDIERVLDDVKARQQYR